MPAPAKPKPTPAAPHGFIQSSGKQEDHLPNAMRLAEKLGWSGDPSWVTNDISVADAVGFIAKVMHEHFIAAATRQEQPSHLAACEHLGIESDEEVDAVGAALLIAFESGKGAPTSSHPVVRSNFGNATLNLDIQKALMAVSAAGKEV